jgi:hypothetical protein
VCDLETSRICTPYIYDIRSLRDKKTDQPFIQSCEVNFSLR